MNLNFFDIQRQHAFISSEIDARINSVVNKGRFILGQEVEELERELCSYTGARFCISCGNGTDAIQIALMAIGVGRNDEIIVPSFNYIASAETVKLLGAKVRYIDVDPNSQNLDVRQLPGLITKNTKAIIGVSLYGRCANFDTINKIAEDNGIYVIEDAAQSFGASYKGRKSCNLTHIGCTSFFPTKPLGCYGDGGAIFTNDEDLALCLRQIARHGQSKRYQHVQLGINSRLDTIQAAVLLEKLKILDREIFKRQKNAEFFDQNIKLSGAQLPVTEDGNRNAWAQYTIVLTERDRFKKHLDEFNIPTFIHYPTPLHKQPSVAENCDNCDVSEMLANSVISIPIHAYLTSEELKYIVEKINCF